ncbi:N-formylglutamate amidohydrolase [Aquamicrobium zhengzhouense]|uniref:N-formylglutamate amidohydrolase n=1 Tax=Aquamicrobium zhengzhouense TaxID=2781738 RepID=A0ABS0SCV8_9HYPH|nr:N-formylglutamate amidohydrolase [Aquamicrobium zhengzhouense]MBI1621076.1 N-formylglutamate amidohydrolase [Aquamicrobium zhengzhouense]
MSDTHAAGRYVEVRNPHGTGAYLLICEHASNAIPAEFARLGLPAETLTSHIAWDPGALAVALEMSRRLDAPLVVQNASRLIYDCNRPPHEPSAMPAVSEIFEIPGNANLSDADRQRRTAEFYKPFRDAVTAQLDARHDHPTLVTVHSFTPIYHGKQRAVEIGLLHDSDDRIADGMIKAARAEGTRFDVQLNEPYGPADGVTHTLREHALPRQIPNVMIEIRNDLIADEGAQIAMANTLCGWLNSAQQSLSLGLEETQGSGS